MINDELEQRLEKAIDSNNAAEIYDILNDFDCPRCSNIYKINDVNIARMIIDKWQQHNKTNAALGDVRLLYSANVEILQMFLDYITNGFVDVHTLCIGKYLNKVGASIGVGIGIDKRNLHCNKRYIKILKIFLQYYPKLNRGNIHKNYSYETKFILRLINNDCNIKLLDWIFQIFDHKNKDKTYLNEVFKLACLDNKIERIRWLMSINPNFNAKIINGRIINYDICSKSGHPKITDELLYHSIERLYVLINGSNLQHAKTKSKIDDLNTKLNLFMAFVIVAFVLLLFLIN